MKVRGIVLLVVGGLALLAGLMVMFAGNDTVLCGSDAMQPGDVCEITSDSETNTLTYEEMQGRDNLFNWVLIGVGVFGLAFGALILRRVAQGKTGPILRG